MLCHYALVKIRKFNGFNFDCLPKDVKIFLRQDFVLYDSWIIGLMDILISITLVKNPVY